MALTINVHNCSIPIIKVNFKNYMGLYEMLEYFKIADLTLSNHKFVLSECSTYSQLQSASDQKYDPDKMFITEAGMVLILEALNVTYSCYWSILCIINNVLDNLNNNKLNDNNKLIDSKILTILQNVQSDVNTIKRFVTVNPD
ncbi:Maph18 [Matsumuraeses phaseoli granulovirus]|uniref:Maph18 n=1 Tax=Matsumuraeses phaseoli granulovirus TaxID=2760664 RepID=A0AAE7MLB3_9BBAC|nr:Maph18 [Matsumuraeses phaseoli granulovirus]QOD39981.1 Maph18 [Matsumuraeses phaseoli granulovirus]